MTIELGRFAPEAERLVSQGADLKRFRRFHRLGEPCLLFVGPYTQDGGLDVAIEAAHRLKESFADVRLAAIPSGLIDQKYLDVCEMRALGLGHRGIIEWTVDDEELPFWYATATAVCAPWRAPVGDATAPRRAAAAGRPFIGSDIEPFRSKLAGASDWATLVPAGDSGALAATATALFEVAVAAKAKALEAAKARIQARTRPELAVEPAQALPTQ
jgi:glycosyltransferase involved in cell wall biosynthesis